MRATAILVGVILAATTAHAGDKMPALKMNRDYIYQCDDEPGGKCSDDELAYIRRSVQRAWDQATDSAREACAPQTTERGMFICLERVMAGASPECSADDPCRKP
jgi:hypothetical protein